MEKFSCDLAAEVRPLGVTIQTVHPGFVITKMVLLKDKSIIAPGPDAFVTGALRSLGLEDRTAGYWSHKIQVIIWRCTDLVLFNEFSVIFPCLFLQIFFVDMITYFVPRRWIENIVMKGTGKYTEKGNSKEN